MWSATITAILDSIATHVDDSPRGLLTLLVVGVLTIALVQMVSGTVVDN